MNFLNVPISFLSKIKPRIILLPQNPIFSFLENLKPLSETKMKNKNQLHRWRKIKNNGKMINKNKHHLKRKKNKDKIKKKHRHHHQRKKRKKHHRTKMKAKGLHD